MVQHENYSRLQQNKQETQSNVAEYLKSKSTEIEDNEGRKIPSLDEFLRDLNKETPPKDIIEKLEEARDLWLGVTWQKSSPHDDGSVDLIRDCSLQNEYNMDHKRATKISYGIQTINVLAALTKVAEVEGKKIPTDDLLTEQLNAIKKGDRIDPKKFNDKILKVLKENGVKSPEKKLSAAKDFVSMDNQQFHVTTITKQKNVETEDVYVIESDNLLLGLTHQQQQEYATIFDGTKRPEWYNKLSDFDKKLVKAYAEKIVAGNFTLPTQTRKHLPGLRNAYEKSVFVDVGGKYKKVLETLHTGTPSFHGKGDKVQQTKRNLQQLNSFLPEGKKLNDNALNSPSVMPGVANFLNAIDRDAPGLIERAQKELGDGSITVTPFNTMRRLNYNNNTGFDKALIEIGASIQQSDGEKITKIAQYLIDGKDQKEAFQELKNFESSSQDPSDKELYNALKNAMDAKKMIVNPSKMFEGENQNMDLVSKMMLVEFAANKGVLKDRLPHFNVEKINAHCASGKDRTGLILTKVTNQAISEALGLDDVTAKQNLKTQIKGSHTQVLASHNGGTPGCHGVKGDSKAALSDKDLLNELIEKTASFNKLKANKSFGEKLGEASKKVVMAAVAIVTLPVTIPIAAVASLGYLAYYGAGKISSYQADEKVVTNVTKKVNAELAKDSVTKMANKEPEKALNNEVVGLHAQKIMEGRSTPPNELGK